MSDRGEGLFFRYSINTFINKRGDIVEKRSMSLLKKISATGHKAEWLMGAIREDICCDMNVLSNQESFVSGRIYELITHGSDEDWELFWIRRDDLDCEPRTAAGDED